jgi:hypothetical protein
MAHHRIYCACGREFKGPIYTEEMGIEMHAAQSAHGPMVVKHEAVAFDAGNKLRLAAAHIAEYYRPL